MGGACGESTAESEITAGQSLHMVKVIKAEADFAACHFVASKDRQDPVTTYFKYNSIGADQVRVKIEYFSLSYADLCLANGSLPSTLKDVYSGTEAVGQVEAKGDLVSKFKVGDIVGLAFTTNIPQYQKLLSKGYTGAYASSIQVPQNLLVQLPKSINLAKAAPLMGAGLTAYSAVKKAKVAKGKKVAVMGFGGLGQLVSQYVKARGVEPMVFSRNKDKKQPIATELGLKLKASGETNSLIGFFDIFFVCSRTFNTKDFSEYFGCLKNDGTLVVLAVPEHAEAFKTDFFPLIIKGAKVMGSMGGDLADLHEVVDLAVKQHIYPSVVEEDFSHLVKAVHTLQADSPAAKIVIKVTDSWRH